MQLVKWTPFYTLQVIFFNMQPFPMPELWTEPKVISLKKQNWLN